MNKKNVSGLSAHKLYRKQGIIVTPLNDGLRNQLALSSWTKERMPEYLWLGLILMYYGRAEGFKKSREILLKIAKEIKDLSHPRLSQILNLPEKDQNSLFKMMITIIDDNVLSPLTILYRFLDYPLFNKYFNIPQMQFQNRLKTLTKAIKIYYDPKANEVADLRFLAQSLLLFGKKIYLAKGMEELEKAFNEYPYTEHDDEKMRIYRPMIRAMEMCDFQNCNYEFSKKFWRGISMINSCTPNAIAFDQNENEYKNIIEQFQNILEYILHANKEKSIFESKFHVIIGSVTYALKIFKEITGKKLGNSILGRHGIRTIIEVLIMLKYLLKREATNHNIWEEYKLYGISKYKLVLLKAREKNIEQSAHFIPSIAELLVNEIKGEELIDIDLKYFDKQGIREKSIDVGEKDLYDIFYDYDSSFAHGLWGAIRESTMLNCNNPEHQYHSIPDIHSNQILSDVKMDSVKIMDRLFSLLIEIYEVPETLKAGIENGNKSS